MTSWARLPLSVVDRRPSTIMPLDHRPTRDAVEFKEQAVQQGKESQLELQGKRGAMRWHLLPASLLLLVTTALFDEPACRHHRHDAERSASGRSFGLLGARAMSTARRLELR